MTRLVLEALVEWARQPSTGVRVTEDGAVAVLVDGAWREAWRCDRAGLRLIQAGAAAAAKRPRPAAPWAGHEDPPERSRWRLAGGPGSSEVRVDVSGPLVEVAPDLDALLQAVFGARAPQEVATRWRYRGLEATVPGEPGGHPGLQEAARVLTQALPAVAGPEPSAPPLVSVSWIVDGVQRDELRVHADGTRRSTLGAFDGRLPAEALERLRHALERVDWGGL